MEEQNFKEKEWEELEERTTKCQGSSVPAPDKPD